MKALTFWQPWGSLVVAGAKPYEFRGWRPPASIVGQRIVIHASVRKPCPRELAQLIRLLNAGGKFAAATCLTPVPAALEVLRRGQWPLGAGLGTAIVCSGRAKRCACGNRADLLCDWKVPTRKSGTCDRPVCSSCTTSPAPDKDLCPKHGAEYQKWLAAHGKRMAG